MAVTAATITAASPQAHVPASPLGTMTAAPATTSATNSSPYGFSQAQADAILALVIEMRAMFVAMGKSL